MNLSVQKLLIALFFFCTACQYKVLDDNQHSDYQQELENIRTKIERLNKQSNNKISEKTALRLVDNLYRYASLSKDTTK